MTKLLLIRHGCSEYNKSKKYAGQSDVPLADIGKLQAELTAKYVLEHYNVDTIYSSDLCRCVQTAEPVAKALSLPIKTDPLLREINGGLWQDKYIDEIATVYKEDYEFYRAHPGLGRCTGGESIGEVQVRALEAVRKIVSENENKTVLIATHNGVILSLKAAWLGISMQKLKRGLGVSNASLTEVDFDGKEYRIAMSGYDVHLKEALTDKPV